MKFVKNSQPNSFNILESAMGHINFNDKYILDLFKSSEIQLKELKSSLLILEKVLFDAQAIVDDLRIFIKSQAKKKFNQDNLAPVQEYIDDKLKQLRKIFDSTEYCGKKLLNKHSRDFIGKIYLLFDLETFDKIEFDFSIFDLSLDAPIKKEYSINNGAHNPILAFSIDSDELPQTNRCRDFRRIYVSDLGVYKTNLEIIKIKISEYIQTVNAKRIFLEMQKSRFLQDAKNRNSVTHEEEDIIDIQLFY